MSLVNEIAKSRPRDELIENKNGIPAATRKCAVIQRNAERDVKVFIFFFKSYFINNTLFHFNNNAHLQMPDTPGIRKAGIIILIMKIIQQK